MTTQDIVVIGGGIVGLSVAYKLLSAEPSLRLTIVEKEQSLGFHQTGHNSGVIHSGIYYKPGSHRALLCREGRAELLEFAKNHNIHHEVCGKIIVATSSEELAGLERIFQRGIENGLGKIRRISGKEIREFEPDCSAEEGIWVGDTGLINFSDVVKALSSEIVRLNPQTNILTSGEIDFIYEKEGVVTLRFADRSIQTRYFVACGGLQCDRLARLDGLALDVRVVPFRGDYFKLKPNSKVCIRNMIYPVPNPLFPFLGVHFTRTIQGEIKCGPNAVLSLAREGYGKLSIDIGDLLETFSFVGSWRLFKKNWRYGFDEYQRTLFKRLFVESVQQLVPKVQASDLIPGKSGIRANLVDKEGNVVDDFMFEQTNHAVHVLNTPSPAATACLAIGNVVAEKVRTALLN